jgi:hypothetical protein
MWKGTALGPDIANRIVDPTEMRRCPSRVEKRIVFLTLNDPSKIGPGAAVAELDCKNVSDFFAAARTRRDWRHYLPRRDRCQPARRGD